MKLLYKSIAAVSLVFMVTLAAFAIDGAQALKLAQDVDQLDDQMEPIGRLDAYFFGMAKAAYESGDMGWIDSLITFPVHNPKVRGLKLKNLYSFKDYEPARLFVYDNLDENIVFNRQLLAQTLWHWGDLDNALKVSATEGLWSLYFKIPHENMFEIASEAITDKSASSEKVENALYYFNREHKESSAWHELAKEALWNVLYRDYYAGSESAKSILLHTLMKQDPDYIVGNSFALANDYSNFIQERVLSFLDTQILEGHPEALVKLHFIAENGKTETVRSKASKLCTRHEE